MTSDKIFNCGNGENKGSSKRNGGGGVGLLGGYFLGVKCTAFGEATSIGESQN